MAIYCFKCTNDQCNNGFEKIESFNQSETEHLCPKCNTVSKKQLNNASVVFVGSDWTPKFYTKE